jgi:membrane-associated PAP2 superfamily phosphatase
VEETQELDGNTAAANAKRVKLPPRNPFSDAKRTIPVSSADRLPPIWVPLLLLIIGSVALQYWNLDIASQRWFWSTEGRWRFEQLGFVDFLYRYGSVPALVVAALGAVVWGASFLMLPLKPARFLGGLLAIAMLVGPGLLINTVLKPHYGRPRPRQVAEFGGAQQFRPLGQPTFDDRGKSFPSGHASMGFFWFVPAIYFWQRSRSIAWVWTGLALLHGGLMGFGRMAQGGHWLSDVLWSAAMVYFSSWILYWALNFRNNDQEISQTLAGGRGSQASGPLSTCERQTTHG